MQGKGKGGGGGGSGWRWWWQWVVVEMVGGGDGNKEIREFRLGDIRIIPASYANVKKREVSLGKYGDCVCACL